MAPTREEVCAEPLLFGPRTLARGSSLRIELGRAGLSAASGIISSYDSTGCSLKTPVSGRALVNPFIDRSFGHNFDPDDPKDLQFIDRVHELDQKLIDGGHIKPTHIIAAMKIRPTHQRVDRHLTPEFCVRKP